MKRVSKGLRAGGCAVMLAAAMGCDHVRDYSVNSYQGAMPTQGYRQSIETASRMPRHTPNPSTPTPAPVAAPAAGGNATTQAK